VPGEHAAAQAGPQAGQQEQAPDMEEEEGPGNMLELLVVFDGGSRGNPGQGYGSFLVQSPGRRPVIRRLEFGDNYTNNQAEYDTLIACLNYIIERLTATGRSPSQVLLDIRNDSELVVNQLLGTYKVKDASMKKRYQQAMELLEQFADWRIEWQPRDETVRLLGH
jgi:ribonuclease HI